MSNVPPHHTGYGFILGREIIHNLSWYLHNQTSPAPPAECWRSKHYESTYDRLCAPWFNLELTLIYISYILLAFRLSILPQDSRKPSILFHSVARSLRRFGRTCCSILSFWFRAHATNILTCDFLTCDADPDWAPTVALVATFVSYSSRSPVTNPCHNRG